MFPVSFAVMDIFNALFSVHILCRLAYVADAVFPSLRFFLLEQEMPPRNKAWRRKVLVRDKSSPQKKAAVLLPASKEEKKIVTVALQAEPAAAPARKDISESAAKLGPATAAIAASASPVSFVLFESVILQLRVHVCRSEWPVAFSLRTLKAWSSNL